MICKVCSANTRIAFSSMLMGKYKADYYYCQNCGFLSTEEPYWLQEAYNRSINISDTGYMQRNIQISKMLTTVLTLFFDYKGKFVDYGGGYGVLVRLMRDIGFDFYWQDKYTQNIFAEGFGWTYTDQVEAVTVFESFEHFDRPMEEMKRLLSISRNIVFSTELLPTPIPNQHEWWYYGLEHGQHISFYSERTLKYMAKRFSLNYLNHGNFHIFTEKSNISRTLLKFVIKLNHLGFYKILAQRLSSKTWEDHLAIAERGKSE